MGKLEKKIARSLARMWVDTDGARPAPHFGQTVLTSHSPKEGIAGKIPFSHLTIMHTQTTGRSV